MSLVKVSDGPQTPSSATLVGGEGDGFFGPI